MNQTKEKSSFGEPTTGPRSVSAMTPARWQWDDGDSPLIADEDMMKDERDEGNGESVVGVVVGKVVRVEDGDDDSQGRCRNSEKG
jgi:hypothetical protein